MEPARLASKQASSTSSSMQQLAGPWTELRATGVPKLKKNVTIQDAIQDGFPQIFYNLRCGRPDPHGREIAKYGGLRPFWPRTALGTYRNPGCGPKSVKHNIRVLGAPFGERIRTPQNFLPESAQVSYILRFGRLNPHGPEIAKHELFGPFWPRTARGTGG